MIIQSADCCLFQESQRHTQLHLYFFTDLSCKMVFNVKPIVKGCTCSSGVYDKWDFGGGGGSLFYDFDTLCVFFFNLKLYFYFHSIDWGYGNHLLLLQFKKTLLNFIFKLFNLWSFLGRTFPVTFNWGFSDDSCFEPLPYLQTQYEREIC